jgi:hypothetical protein
MWFAQSSTPMYINYKGEIQGWKFVFILQLGGPKRCSYWGHAQCFKKNAGGSINMAPFKIKIKNVLSTPMI